MTTTSKEFNARNGALIGTSSANYLQLLGNTAGNAVTIAAQGTDTNININLLPKGTGIVNLPTSFVGQTSITTVGTITTGTWCGTLGAISGANLTNITASTLNLNAYCSLGVGGLNSSSTGYNNIAIGHAALYCNTTGSNNVAQGYKALFSNTTGNSNIAVGYYGLRCNSTGNNNTAFGCYALACNTTGCNNSANGQLSLGANTTGCNNNAQGYYSLRGNTTGKNNFASGYQALYCNTTGSDNFAQGYRSLYCNLSGLYNVAIGTQSMYYNSTGSNNIAIGANALFYNSTGYANFAAGCNTLYNNTTGSNNVAIGTCALYANITGINNIAIGFCSGAQITTGSNNVIIGGYSASTGPMTVTSSNTIVLSDGAGNVRQFIDSSGNVGIGLGTSIPNYKLHVAGSFAATSKSFLIDHPTKFGMKLRYGSLESPYHGVRLTGQSVIVGKSCKVELPEYIKGLCKQEGSQVQITNIKHGKILWVDDIVINENYFIIGSDNNDEIEYHFYWSFTAIRKDIDDMIVEF